jgi:hypothetical protein
MNRVRVFRTRTQRAVVADLGGGDGAIAPSLKILDPQLILVQINALNYLIVSILICFIFSNSIYLF